MVFIIQHTQNRDSEAAQIKLDEIIRALKKADNVQLDLEDRTQEQLDTVKKKYTNLAKKERKKSNKRKQQLFRWRPLPSIIKLPHFFRSK